MGESLRISLKLNFTPNTLGCYGSTLLELKGCKLPIKKKRKREILSTCADGSNSFLQILSSP